MMKIKKLELNISLPVDEACKKAREFLCKKVHEGFSIKSVKLCNYIVSIHGHTSKWFGHDFTVNFWLQHNGLDVFLELKDVDITNTWFLFGLIDFKQRVNDRLAKSIRSFKELQSFGVHYKSGKVRLSLFELLQKFGINLEGTIVGTTCDSEKIGLEIGYELSKQNRKS